jgi:hypothetical protein
MFNDWMRLTSDVTLLGLESQRVVTLRLACLAIGDAAAEAEARRMILEKGAALMEAATTLAFGGSAGKVVRRYRMHVRANERRLMRRSFVQIGR